MNEAVETGAESARLVFTKFSGKKHAIAGLRAGWAQNYRKARMDRPANSAGRLDSRILVMEEIALAAPTVDMSLWGLFAQAGWIVKLVMIGLLGASVWTWALVIEKTLAFSRMRRALDRFEQVFWSGQSLEDLYRTLADRNTIGMGSIFVAAMREWKKSFERGARSPIGLQMRIEKSMDVALTREMETLEARLTSLATIGSAGPFVGLFGTVIGIMTSFMSIAASKNTNLSVVAPGIAEALLATAIGLVAAIPAVIAYNKLHSDAAKIGSRLEGFADEFSAILSRQIDEKIARQG